jgi:hypothetical protein
VYARQKEYLEGLCHDFALLYQKLFGKNRMTYNMHIFCNHLDQIAEQRPLSRMSAFPFEATYADMLRSCKVGTSSTGKQVLCNMLLATAEEGHVCQPSLKLKLYNSTVTCDRNVKGKDGKFYQLQGSGHSRGVFVAKRIIVERYEVRGCKHAQELSFDAVEVFKYVCVEETFILLQLRDIETVAVLVQCGEYVVIVSMPFFELFNK